MLKLVVQIKTNRRKEKPHRAVKEGFLLLFFIWWKWRNSSSSLYNPRAHRQCFVCHTRVTAYGTEMLSDDTLCIQWSKGKRVWGSLLWLSDLRTGQENDTVCLGCKGKATLFWCSSTLESPVAPTLLSICEGKMSVGNLIPSFRFTKTVWLLCWNLNLKHLFLGHSGKGYIVPTCEVQEDKGRSKSPTIMRWELCGYRCFSGDLWREFHWVSGCTLSLKEIKIKFYQYAIFTMTSLNPE